MASYDDAERVDRGIKEGKHEEDEGGFIDKGQGFHSGHRREAPSDLVNPLRIHIPCINLKKADIVVDVLIKNPNPPLIDINYLIESDGRKLVSGLIPDAGTIHAHGEETVKVPLHLIYDDIKSTYYDIEPGSNIPYRIKVDLLRK